MPKEKKIEAVQLPEEVPSKEFTFSRKEKIFNLLKAKIPGLFDIHPNGSISVNGLNKLVEEIDSL